MPNRQIKLARVRHNAQFNVSSLMAHKKVQSPEEPVSNYRASYKKRVYIEQLIQELSENVPAAQLLKSKNGRNMWLEDSNLGAIVAHELRQPLFTIAMATENLRLALAEDGFDRAVMAKSVKRIADQVDRAQAIINQTLSGASHQNSTQESSGLARTLENAIELFGVTSENSLELVCELPNRELVVGMSQIALEQVFLNILRNAQESITQRRSTGWTGLGRIVISSEQRGDTALCVISDNGAGLLPEAEATAFQPFFTTKGNDGTGLGLHICRQNLMMVRGNIKIKAGRHEGAVIELTLPLLGQK